MNGKMLQLRTLGFFIKKKRQSNRTLTRDDFLAAGDYHEFLKDAEPAVRAATDDFKEDNHDESPLALDEIDLSQLQYEDVVIQMFDARVAYSALSFRPDVAAPLALQNYFDNYLSSLGGDNRTKCDVESTMDRINEVLALPTNVGHRVNGLVVGRVQSGKTRNYVGLMLKAAGEGWNVMIVLTSANTQLADQTESRIAKDFGKAHANAAIRLEFREGAVPDPPAAIRAKNGSFYWGVAMKESSNLQRVLRWLHDCESFVPDMSILVVDDEADNATPIQDGDLRNVRHLNDGEIDDFAEAANDSLVYAPVAKWMESVQESLQAVQDDAAIGKDTPETREVKRLEEILARTATETGDILPAFDGLLGLEDPNLRQTVQKFFADHDIVGAHRDDCFVRFLNTVLRLVLNRSAINRYVCELVGELPGMAEPVHKFARTAYVAYTATPYACILNERPDQTPIYPDFIKSLTVSPQYFGLERIFGTDVKTDVPAMGIVRPIPDEDKRFVLNPIQNIKDSEIAPRAVLKPSIRADLGVSCDNPPYIGFWDSMRQAIAWTFCAAAARRRLRLANKAAGAPDYDPEELPNRWTTMLVNVSQLRKTHAKLEDYVKNYIQLRCGDSSKAFFLRECERTWAQFCAEFPKAEFDKLFNSGPAGDSANYGDIADYPSWQDLAPHVGWFADRWRDDQNVHVITINSAGPARNRPQDLYNQTDDFKNQPLLEDHLWIVCGGNTISRGLTLHGLVASYFDRVRRTVAVDTMTQMGRWFGYRPGYELLPRIWMLPATVKEMKNTAVVERNMHESIARNFDDHNSPADPDHYQEIYCWGRKLSGRAAAANRLTKPLGAIATTNDLPAERANVAGAAAALEDFILQMGAQLPRPGPEFLLYGDFPLWADIPKAYIRDLLEETLPFYPDNSRRTLRSLVAQIDGTRDPAADQWYFTIGVPKRGAGNDYSFALNDGGELKIRSGNPSSAEVRDGFVRAQSIRNYLAFYSMVPTRFILLTDAFFLRKNADAVAKVLDARKDPATGAYSPAVDKILRAFPQPETARKIEALAESIEVAKGRMDPRDLAPVHDSIPDEGVRNRSSTEYRERLYSIFHDETGRPRNPILQAYLITPPAGVDADGKPLVSWSFYWPDLPPDDFHVVSIGS